MDTRPRGLWEGDPEGYRFMLASAALAVPGGAYISYLYFSSPSPPGLGAFAATILYALLLAPVHEAVHLAAARLLGLRYSFGLTVTGPVAVIWEGEPWRVAVIAAAPMVLLAVVPVLPCLNALLAYLYVAMSAGDFYAVYRAVRLAARRVHDIRGAGEYLVYDGAETAPHTG